MVIICEKAVSKLSNSLKVRIDYVTKDILDFKVDVPQMLAILTQIVLKNKGNYSVSIVNVLREDLIDVDDFVDFSS